LLDVSPLDESVPHPRASAASATQPTPSRLLSIRQSYDIGNQRRDDRLDRADVFKMIPKTRLKTWVTDIVIRAITGQTMERVHRTKVGGHGPVHFDSGLLPSNH
jgi:hypothetical protein